MIISTILLKPVSKALILFNCIIFLLFKLIIFKNFNASTYEIFWVTIFLALFSGGIYSLLVGKYLNFNEKYVIKNYGCYYEKFKCNVFCDFNADYIFKIKDGACTVYLNEDIAQLVYNDVEMKSHMEKLRSRMRALNRRDKLCIYAYKYGRVMLFSIACFALWQICSYINIGGSIADKFLTILILIITGVLIIFFYSMLNDLFLKFIWWILEKRNLDFFKSKYYT